MLDSVDDYVHEQDGIGQNRRDAVEYSHNDDRKRLESGRRGQPGAYLIEVVL